MSFILVVDPDAKSAAAIERALTADGLEVKVVVDPDAALQVAAAQAPKLVIVSSEVPRADSLLESFARARGGPGSVAVVTGDGTKGARPHPLSADEILTRPFSEDDVKGAVERCWAAERVSEASPSAGGRQLSSEEIFGDVLAELAGDEDAAVEAEEKQIEDLQAAAESLARTPQDPAEAAVPDIGGDVDELLAGALSELQMESGGSPSKTLPSVPEAEDVDLAQELSLLAAPPPEEALAPQPSPSEPFSEQPAESGEAPTEVAPALSEISAGEADRQASTVEEVEALAALGLEEDEDSESRSRIVLVGAIGGTAIIGILLVVVLNFMGREEPGATEPAVSVPVRELQLAPDQSSLVAGEEDAAEGEADAGEEAQSSQGEDPSLLTSEPAESAQQPEAAPETIDRQPEPDLPEETDETEMDTAAEPELDAAAPDDSLSEADDIEPDSLPPQGSEVGADLGVETPGEALAGEEISERSAADADERLPEEPSEPPGVTVDQGEEVGDVRQPVPADASPPVGAPEVRFQEVDAPAPAVTDREAETAPAPAQAPIADAAATEDSGGAVAPGPGVVQPELRRFDPPPYPRQARQMKLQGTVVISVLVDETGKVVDAKVLRGALKRFDEDVLKAARKATFEPATKDGRPVSMWKSLAVQMRPNN